MTTIGAQWNGGNGDWFGASNWSEPNPNGPPALLHYVPNSTNDVFVTGTGTAAGQVVIAYNGTDTVNTLNSSGFAVLNMTGGSLTVLNNGQFNELDLGSAATLVATNVQSLNTGVFMGTVSGTGTLRFVNGTFNIDAGFAITAAIWLLDYQVGSGTVSNTVLNTDLTYANNLILQSPLGNMPFLTLNGHTLTLSGTSSLNGNIGTGGTLKITGTSTITNSAIGYGFSGGNATANASTFENAGAVTQSGNVGLNGTILNDAGHTWTFTAGTVVNNGGTFANNGTLAVAASDSGEVDGTLNNAGTISVASGATLALAVGTETLSGVITGAGTLTFGFAHNATLAPSALTVGSISVNGGNGGGTLAVGSALAYAGTFTFTDQFGFLNLSGNVFTLSGTSLFSTGSLYGGGTLKVTGSGTIGNLGVGYGPGGYTTANAATIEDAGSVTQTGGISLNGAIVVDAGATWTFTGGSVSSSGATFASSGTIAVSANVSSEIDGAFGSNGRVTVASGATLVLAAGSENVAGTVSGPGTLVFGFGHTVYLAPSALTVGTINVNGGNGGGVVNLEENLVYAGVFNFTDQFGSINLNGQAFTLSGMSTLSGGSVYGANGTLRITGTDTIGSNIAIGYGPGGYTTANATVFENAGSVTQSGNLTLNGVIVNDAGHNWLITGGNISNSGATFVNSGLLAVGVGVSSEIDATFGNAGAVAAGTGTLILRGSIDNDGALSVGSGKLVLSGPVVGDAGRTGAITIGAGGVVDAQGSVSANQNVLFGYNSGTLQLDSVAGYAGSITGFQAGDTIDVTNQTLTGVVYTPSGGAGGTLTLFNGTTAVGTLALKGAYAGRDFGIHADPSGTGVDITVAAASDFNGDGKSDLVIQNDSGAIDIFTDNGLALSGGSVLGNPGPTWHVEGTGDFNGDGQADLLLQNDSGAVVDYLMSGTGIVGGGQLGNPGASWHVRGVGDFNADGRSDVLLQNDNGTMLIWNVTGSAVTGGGVIGQLPSGWSVAGVGDFNGDGVADILAQNAATSALVVYTTNGDAISGGGLVGTPGAGWSVNGIGDYNGDGKSDILLHNDNGADVIWTVNGSSLTSSVYLGNPGPTYTGAVAGVDLNGDGSSDLVVQNSGDGSLVGYTLNNNATITAGALLTVPGSTWHAIGDVPTFIQNGGAAGVLTGTGGADQFNETTPAIGLHTISAFDPAIDTVALAATQFPNFAAVQSAAQPYQGGTFIDFNATTALVIAGVAPSQLTAANFVLR